MTAAWPSAAPNLITVARGEAPDDGLLPQQLFTSLLAIERKRTERSERRFILMLLECARPLRLDPQERLAATLASVLGRVARDTDLKGWYRRGATLGVIFTEIGAGDSQGVVKALSDRVTEALVKEVPVEDMGELSLAFHVYPEDWDDDGTPHSVSSAVQLALAAELRRNPVDLRLKRAMDIAGSLALLLLLLPPFVLIAIAIRLNSRGPVLFRQVRLGQYGRPFTFLKFRSMYVNNDHAIHEKYIQEFIAGGAAAGGAPEKKVYKLTSDPRITPVGRFLRKSSLDELPQFLNVLTGEMSLVGPRPPVIYEYKRYHLWHKQRLLAVKPGITGLWQVHGRSRVKFDDMVRLDIRYARTRSFWLDVKILLQTPRAVMSGEGAC